MGYLPRPGMGTSPDLEWGTPPRPGTGYHPKCEIRWGTPPPTDQHSEHLLRGGRYASCVHAGGLSCSLKIGPSCRVILIKLPRLTCARRVGSGRPLSSAETYLLRCWCREQTLSEWTLHPSLGYPPNPMCLQRNIGTTFQWGFHVQHTQEIRVVDADGVCRWCTCAEVLSEVVDTQVVCVGVCVCVYMHVCVCVCVCVCSAPVLLIPSKVVGTQGWCM